MTQRPKTARSRAARPTLEGLEARALLSTMTPQAEVSALRAHPTSQSILQNLTPLLTATTVATNGDNNPYGVAFIPKDFPAGGKLKPGDILVSDFNGVSTGTSVQATGVSIVSIDPAGNTTTFYTGPQGLGLNTALGVLPGGFIIVVNTPRTMVNGTATVAPGSLLILDRNGNVVETLSASDPVNKLDGPWGLTIVNQGSTSHVFVSNVLNGTVTRIDMSTRHGKPPKFMGAVEVASGYAFATNPAALVVGPQGLAFDARRHVLYVASTADNAIFTVLHPLEATSSKGTGTVFAQNDGHLNGPLSLALAPNGHLLVTNGDAILPNAPPPPFNLILEYQPPRGRATTGTFVAQLPIDNTGVAGGAFGLAIGSTRDHNQILAAVDDNSNSLIEWTIKKTK